jgi:hypothetical protein
VRFSEQGHSIVMAGCEVTLWQVTLTAGRVTPSMVQEVVEGLTPPCQLSLASVCASAVAA